MTAGKTGPGDIDPREPHDSGMTLIEVLVGMGLFAVLGSLLLGAVLSTARVTEGTRDRTNVNEEARLAMERMTREVRQANIIDSVTIPATPGGGITSFTFWTDFDGNGLRGGTAADPELLTYRWDPATERLTLTAHDAATDETRPVLAANVSFFEADLRSSRWQYDANKDGITTWKELDLAAAPVGNHNATADVELELIDLLSVRLTVDDASGSETYRTQIDLRNRN